MNSFRRIPIIPLQINFHRSTLNILRNIDNFLNSRDSQSDILGRNTSKMEGIKSHLSHCFSERLGSNGATHLSWINLGLNETTFNFIKEIIESFFIEFIIEDNFLGTKFVVKKSSEEIQRSIVEFFGKGREKGGILFDVDYF